MSLFVVKFVCANSLHVVKLIFRCGRYVERNLPSVQRLGHSAFRASCASYRRSSATACPFHIQNSYLRRSREERPFKKLTRTYLEPISQSMQQEGEGGQFPRGSGSLLSVSSTTAFVWRISCRVHFLLSSKVSGPAWP